MTPEQVRGRVRDIEAMAMERDPERCHIAQDELLFEVLHAIATGQCGVHSGLCAQEALEVTHIDFPRWFA